MNLLISPHSDDETLSAAYIQLRYKPLVVICLEGRRKKTYVPNETRVAETAAATRLLGCDFQQLPVKCDPVNWPQLAELLSKYNPDRVWAPLPENDGHSQHNEIGKIAHHLWPNKTEFYSTYTTKGRSTIGQRVQEEPGWEKLKRKALACYTSQLSKPDTAFHFEQKDISEYVTTTYPGHVRGLRLNLGSGPNPIEGFDNLDKEQGWTFESGLTDYIDSSVEAITVSHVLMYVPIEHWSFVFSEFHRVLEPGGVIRITEDSTDDPESSRQGLRHRASVATTPGLVRGWLEAAGFVTTDVTATTTQFVDQSLLQANYGEAPDVFFIEAEKPTEETQ